MPFRIYVVEDYEHMSQVAANITIGKIASFIRTEEKPNLSFVLPTGGTPIRLYEIIKERQHSLDLSTVISHNLDEYAGLPGNTITDRILNPESYGAFVIANLPKFHERHIPGGCEIDQEKLEKELDRHKDDPSAYHYEGISNGKNGLAIVIPENSIGEYLREIKENILDSYLQSIRKHGKVDSTVVGVGGGGHIGFHESEIPLNLEILLMKLAENTIQNAVEDKHFTPEEKSPRYAVSLGAGFIFNPNYNSEILLLANGERKQAPIGEALFGDIKSLVPISGCQDFARNGGRVIWVVDEIAAEDFAGKKHMIRLLENKGIQVTDLRK